MNKEAYRPDIDGLRAIAVFLVIIYHAFPLVLPGGFMGVDIFFVISGYLITGIIIKDTANQNFSFAQFYARRFRRIVPALFVVLVATFFLGWQFLMYDDFLNLAKHVVSGATFTSNFRLQQEAGYFDRAVEFKPLLHLWSLAVEEQFYLIWPICLVLMVRWKIVGGLLIIGLFLLSFISNVLLVTTYPAQVFFMLPTRFWELLAGCGLAYFQAFSLTPLKALKSSRVLNAFSFIGLALLIAAELTIKPGIRVPGWWALFPVFSAFFFICAGPEALFNRLVLSTRPFVFVGLISYPLYLWHWPLLSIARTVYEEDLHVSDLLSLLAASFVLAWLTWVLVEHPIRSKLKIDRSRVTYAVIVSALALLTFVGALGNFSSKRILKLWENGRKIAILGDLENYNRDLWRGSQKDRCFLGSPADIPSNFNSACYTPRPGKNIFLWGDSFGAHLLPGLMDYFSYDKTVNILQITTANCVPIVGPTVSRIGACEEMNNFAIQQIKNAHPQVVVLSGNWLEYYDREKLNSGIQKTVDRLMGVGVKHVVVVSQTPVWKKPLPEILERYFVRRNVPIPRESTISLETSVFSIDQLLKSKKQKPGVTLVSPVDTLCKSGKCTVMLGENTRADLMSLDGGHYTFKAAVRVVSDQMGPLIKSIFQKE